MKILKLKSQRKDEIVFPTNRLTKIKLIDMCDRYN